VLSNALNETLPIVIHISLTTNQTPFDVFRQDGFLAQDNDACTGT
jgi:hypothetical protein